MSNKIEYGFAESPFGPIIVARTWDGICDLHFLGYNRMEVIHELGTRWGMYTPTTQSDVMANTVERVLFEGYEHPLRLDVKGTPFQRMVWRELLNIPFGTTITYGELAERVGKPNAVRNVTAAVEQTPVAVLIPSHRVIMSDGTPGTYHWGTEIKQQLLEWEHRKATSK